ncbi:hypothetical protein QYE76_026759 [Lolium multiflorum]|uniref:Uncharacterized protein n=1 Tax=Lolium multiflorum TaxID=4521 RepID=A0AAD8VVJ1_LOLMU|nr:hypothetical protein QYE76_026759 [Lolium multiflorum]
MGELKVNVDAGWDEGAKSAGLGVVIRDSHGQMNMVTVEAFFLPVALVDEAEARLAEAFFLRFDSRRRPPPPELEVEGILPPVALIDEKNQKTRAS